MGCHQPLHIRRLQVSSIMNEWMDKADEMIAC